VRAGAVPPAILDQNVFAFQDEKRVATAVELPFAAAAAPSAPTEAQLRRYWQNHPDLYSTPEFRRIKVVILAPETLAKDMPVTEEDLRAAYEARKSEFQVPEKRTVQVLVTQDETKARALAAQWQKGADWADIEKAAKATGGASAVQLDDATENVVPLPSLAKAIFAAKPDAIDGPMKTELGWYVFKVAKVTPATNRSFEQVKHELRKQVALQKASDAIYDRANKVEDALAGGSSLADLPGNLGLAAVTGTLDDKGMTPSGEPAPIPGPPDLRQAVISAAFHTKPGEPTHLVEVPPPAGAGQDQVSSYYALEVEKVTPPSVKPFDQVKPQVEADWRKAEIRHEQETAAANILAAVKHGQSLEDAALKAGMTVRKLPAVGRNGHVEGVPEQLVRPLFALKKGQPTMVETPTGFVVAVLSAIEEPDPKAEPGAYARVVEQLRSSFADDVENIYITAVRARDNPRINRQLVASMAQP
jgi:peptidyl-prolyl cis-trans isomerase D